MCLVQVSSGGHDCTVEDLGTLTMTPLFVAVSVLKGFQHSISSQLLLLFFSPDYLALGSKSPDDKVFEMFAKRDMWPPWWMTRFGAMVSQEPCYLDCIEDSELTCHGCIRCFSNEMRSLGAANTDSM